MDTRLLNTYQSSSESNQVEIKVYDIDQAIERAGGFGKFQWIYVSLAAVCFDMNGYFLQNLSYLTLIPVLKWPTVSGYVTWKSHNIDPCENGKLKPNVYVDFSNEKSLHNWITEMDLYCVEPYQTSLFGALFFSGVLLSMIIMAYTSKFGRQKNLIISTWLTLADVLFLVFVNNLYAKYAGMFILGALLIRNITSYILSTELSPKRCQLIVVNWVLGFDVLTLPITSVYFKFINDDWKYATYAIVGLWTLITIGSWFLPESPRFLYEKGKFKEAREIVLKMAKMNKSTILTEEWIFQGESSDLQNCSTLKINRSYLNTTDSDTTIDKSTVRISQAEVDTKLNPFAQMRLNPLLFTNLWVAIFTWIGCSFNYFLLSFDVKNLGGNMFINASLITFAGITGKMWTIFMIKKLSTKSSIFILFMIVFIFGFGLVFFKTGWMISICIAFVEVGLGGAFSLTYFINTEYFPPLFLGFAFAVTQFAARGSSILSYLLSDLEPPMPMILLCIITGVALLTLVFLKKTGEIK